MQSPRSSSIVSCKHSFTSLILTSFIDIPSELSRWLWAKVLRLELDSFMQFRNGAKMRKDAKKAGPSGVSRNEAFSLFEEWGGRNCILPVDLDVIREIKEAMGGDSLLEFTTSTFSKQAQVAYDSQGIVQLSFENCWDIFTAMHPLLDHSTSV